MLYMTLDPCLREIAEAMIGLSYGLLNRTFSIPAGLVKFRLKKRKVDFP